MAEMISRQEVTSSQIKSIGHDGDKLHVEYRGGGVYEYQGINAEDFNALMAAESIGKAFHTLKKTLNIVGSRIDDEATS